MVQQILGAILAVGVALAACFAYFWGTNWLLDRFLATDDSMSVETVTRRDLRRSSIRPWLFIFPALLFLVLYLVYPVVETLRLSLYDKYGLNARMRYTWRSSYVSDDPFYFGLPLINGARGQLNASLNYAISERFTVGFEGVNLLRGDQVQYCVNNKALLCFQGLTDRRLTAGLSMRF